MTGRSRSVDRPTLAIITPSREDGGAERYLRAIAGAAHDRGWEVHVGCPAIPGTARLVDELRQAGIRCHCLRTGAVSPSGRAQALRSAGAEALATLGLLARARPTATLVILPHPDQAPGLALAAAIWPVRSLASTHLAPPGLTFTALRRRFYGICRALGQRWVAVSADNQRRLASALGVAASAISVVPNGVEDIAVASEVRHEVRDRVRAELEIDRRAKVIVTVGRLNAQKGYDLIADSIPAVLAHHRDVVWMWVGDGPSRTWLTQRLQRAGTRDHVRMLGARDDVPSLLAASDLFVLPSRYEGSPFALLEALVCELPVLVSDVGPLPEIVRDGIDGRTARADSAVALALAIVSALDSSVQMQAWAAAGRRRVLGEFSCERMVSSTLALLVGLGEPSDPPMPGAPATDSALIVARPHRPTDTVRPRGAR